MKAVMTPISQGFSRLKPAEPELLPTEAEKRLTRAKKSVYLLLPTLEGENNAKTS